MFYLTNTYLHNLEGLIGTQNFWIPQKREEPAPSLKPVPLFFPLWNPLSSRRRLTCTRVDPQAACPSSSHTPTPQSAAAVRPSLRPSSTICF